jgi:hypothetical protein
MSLMGEDLLLSLKIHINFIFWQNKYEKVKIFFYSYFSTFKKYSVIETQIFPMQLLKWSGMGHSTLGEGSDSMWDPSPPGLWFFFITFFMDCCEHSKSIRWFLQKLGFELLMLEDDNFLAVLISIFKRISMP